MRSLKHALAVALLAAVCCPDARGQAVVGPAGVYTVQTTGSTKVEYGDGWVKITWANDPTPDPTPTPIPEPTPPPAPVATGKLHVTWVYDSDAETQDQATARADLASAAEWGDLDVKFLALEDTQKALDSTGLRKYVTATPMVIIQESKDDPKVGVVVKTLLKPADKAAVVAVVKQLRGAK